MEIFKSSYYIRGNKYLSFFGHWPYQNAKIRVRNQILTMAAIFTVFVPQAAKMIEIRHHFHLFILSIPSMLYYTQFIGKNLVAIVARQKIKDILEKIKHDFQFYKGDDLEVLHNYSRKANQFNYFYTVYMFMVVSAYSILPLSLHVMDTFMPLANQTRLQQKPRLIKYYIDTFDNNIFFIIFHGSMADMMAIIFVIGFDTLYLSFAYHACALFTIVSNKVKQTIDVDLVEGEANRERNEIISYEKFVKTIKIHKYVLDFVNTIETAFATLNLLSIGCAMIPLTITGFEVLLNKGNFGEMVRYFLYAFAEIVHLFYYNWPGQKIREHSLLIYQSCYTCQWYKADFSIKSKKLMKLVMIRSQKPSFLTAGKVYILGLENFAAVIKVSMSYFTVLSSVV